MAGPKVHITAPALVAAGLAEAAMAPVARAMRLAEMVGLTKAAEGAALEPKAAPSAQPVLADQALFLSATSFSRRSAWRTLQN